MKNQYQQRNGDSYRKSIKQIWKFGEGFGCNQHSNKTGVSMTIITQEKINTHKNAYNNKILCTLNQFWNPAVLSLIQKLVYTYKIYSGGIEKCLSGYKF